MDLIRYLNNRRILSVPQSLVTSLRENAALLVVIQRRETYARPPESPSATRSTTPPPDSASEILNSLKDWKPDKDLNALYELTRASLDEVSRLTQYQDEKASRILTAIAFLSALAGGVYGDIVTKGVLHPSFQLSCQFLFFAFAAVVIVGVGFVIYGIRPSFNIPRSWSERQQSTSKSQAPGKPRSFLFALQIIKTDPGQWATAAFKTPRSHVPILRCSPCFPIFSVRTSVRFLVLHPSPGKSLHRMTQK